ncbi:MAG: EVE domain-containing protein [Bdellovibrionota bacterium]
MQYWLMKSEPDCYSVDDLKKDKKSLWTGVRNYQARNFMTQQMAQGDGVLFYHSNAQPPGIAGLARVSSDGDIDDPTQFLKNDEHYDPKATREKPIWGCVEVEWIETFQKYLSLEFLKGNPKLADLGVLKKGTRLSVLPVSEKDFKEICKMAGAKKAP